MEGAPFKSNWLFENAMVYSRKAEASTGHAQIEIFEEIVATATRINKANEERFRRDLNR
jgi:hypothetical protein